MRQHEPRNFSYLLKFRFRCFYYTMPNCICQHNNEFFLLIMVKKIKGENSFFYE